MAAAAAAAAAAVVVVVEEEEEEVVAVVMCVCVCVCVCMCVCVCVCVCVCWRIKHELRTVWVPLTQNSQPPCHITNESNTMFGGLWISRGTHARATGSRNETMIFVLFKFVRASSAPNARVEWKYDVDASEVMASGCAARIDVLKHVST
jgi:hypothetical protein